MKTILRVTFDYGSFKGFSIDNPGHIPSHGEIFSCEWEDFIEDRGQIQEIEELEEDDCWMVERFSSKFSKEENVCHIILHTSESFTWNTSSGKSRQ